MQMHSGKMARAIAVSAMLVGALLSVLRLAAMEPQAVKEE